MKVKSFINKNLNQPKVSHLFPSITHLLGVNIDSIFDPWMRAVTLVTAIKSYVAQQTFKPTPLQGDGENYFVIHPVLKSLAIKVAQNHGTEIVHEISEFFIYPI